MNQSISRRGAVATLAVVGLALTLAPAAVGADRVSASFYGGGADLLPSVGYSQAVLVISGAETVERRVFGAGETPTFGAFNAKGEMLADGVYTWELELIPDPATARALRQVAELAGGEAPDARRPESGSFAVVGGAIVGPGLVEAGQEQKPRGGRPAAAAAEPGRASQGDDDASVGMSQGVEEAMRAAAASQDADAARPVDTSYRSDAVAAARGLSSAAPISRAVAGAVATRPTSDGSHGREKDQ